MRQHIGQGTLGRMVGFGERRWFRWSRIWLGLGPEANGKAQEQPRQQKTHTRLSADPPHDSSSPRQQVRYNRPSVWVGSRIERVLLATITATGVVAAGLLTPPPAFIHPADEESEATPTEAPEVAELPVEASSPTPAALAT
ncbi:MAG: hypothetical protein M3336_17920, partial [Chloroflexota bacterium]|nr:hypothetical protein [Chloroflexota bacterium]